jgi:putative zinc finger protein
VSEFPKIAKARLAASQSGSTGMQHHPDADLLNAFAERRLAGQERESVTAHLAVCPDCREVVSLAVAAAPEGAMAEEPVRESIRWTWMRWAIPAASMAIILVAVSLRWQETSGNLEGKRQVDAYVPPPKAAEPASTAEAKTSADQNPASAANKVAAVATPQPATPVAGGGGRGEIAQSSNGRVLADRRADAAAGNITTRPQNYEYRGAPRESQPGFVAGGAVPQQERDGRPAAAPPTTAIASGAAAPALIAPEKKDAKVAENVPALNALATKNKADQDKLAAASESVEASAPTKTADQELAKRRKTESAGGLVGSLDESKAAADSASGIGHAYAAPAVARQMAAPKQVVAGSEANLWRGGKAGALFHSNDGGKIWKQVPMTSGGKTAASDVTALEVNGKNVTVKFADGFTWTSADEGITWKIQAPAPAKK